MGRPIVLATVAGADRHDTGAGHPERPERVLAVQRGIEAAGLGDAICPIEGRPATRAELERVHHPQYLDALEELACAGGGALDPDTPMAAGSWDTARLAAGLGLAAAELLAAGEADAGFVCPRPPGHHARAGRAMGFCLLNNVAVTAAALTDAGHRVAIVDWDVHHGNGTQDLFWDDPRVLFVSTHQWPCYPGTGAASETGGPNAPGLTVNVPLPPGATGDVVLAALDEVVAPVMERFAPDWVLVSAGFDAHRADPLADLGLSAGDFALLARRVAAYAPSRGRLLAFLEGGYDLDALAASAGATVAALVDVDHRSEPPTSGGPGREAVRHAAESYARCTDDQGSKR